MDASDSKWEFSCPQFVDFSVNPHECSDNADVWFDNMPYDENSVQLESFSDKADKTLQDVAIGSKPASNARFFPRNTLRSPVLSPVIKKLRLSTSEKKFLSHGRSHRRLSSHHVLRNRYSNRPRLSQYGRTILSSARKRTVTTKSIEPNKEVDFVASLRRYDGPTASDPKVASRVTLPVPFKLSSNQMKTTVPTFRSMAEQVIAFQNQIPDRFRTTKKIDTRVSDIPLTNPLVRKPPQTPRLLTRMRSRPTTVVGNDEKERLEVEEMKKFQFHANPINPSILSKPNELPKVEAKAATVVHPFNLRSISRSSATITSQEEASVTTFTARPVPKGLFDNPKFAKTMTRQLTSAKSPAFSLKERASHWQDVDTERNDREVRETTRTKRLTAPVSSEPFVPKLEHRRTAVEPFNFEERDVVRQERKEEKIKKILLEEKQMREFHAQPLPDPAVSGLPTKQTIPGTKLEPFHLRADDRGKLKQTKWIEQMKQDLQDQKAKLQFKAKPCKTIYENPFLPQRMMRPLTDSNNFELETEKRAKDRKVFDELLKEKEARNEEVTREREERRLEEERLAVEVVRKNAVHRAQPVRRYKEVNFEGSDIPLTKPFSPNFATKKRKRQL